MSADADLNGRAVTLICNGTNWVVEQATFTGTCANNTPITYDNATGGLRCGSADIIAPVWVTATGIIATVDVNDMVNVSVAASDESGAPTYQKISGAAWISVAANGAITGKAPATGGTYSVTVRTTDAAGNSPANRNFDIIVNLLGGPVGCTNHGDACPDGTVYAGKSPDGNVDMFVTPNDAPGGDLYTWNDGSSNFVNTALADCGDGSTFSTCRTGASNTATLIISDSSSVAGFQYHNAARVCFCWGEEHLDAPNGVVPSECAGFASSSYDGHEKDDWYLPAAAEMDVIYVNLVSPSDPDNPTWQDGANGGDLRGANDGPQASTFGTTGDPYFYTSSEAAINKIVAVSVADNGEYNQFGVNYKDNTMHVRCARKN